MTFEYGNSFKGFSIFSFKNKNTLSILWPPYIVFSKMSVRFQRIFQRKCSLFIRTKYRQTPKHIFACRKSKAQIKKKYSISIFIRAKKRNSLC